MTTDTITVSRGEMKLRENDLYKIVEFAQDHPSWTSHNIMLWAHEANLFCATPRPDDLLPRLKTAIRALVRERVVYWEDVETLADVVKALESIPHHASKVPDDAEIVLLPMKAAQAILNAFDEAVDGLLAASVDRQPTKLGRDRQRDRLATVRAARYVFEIAVNWKAREAAAPECREKV